MKLSISLPDGLVGQLDRARGDVPRSLFIRRELEGRGWSDPAPAEAKKAAREARAAEILGSPVPAVDSGVPRGPSDAELEALVDEAGRAVVEAHERLLARPVVARRHAATCKCAVCKPVKS